MVDAALGYAAAGWPVFPCVATEKVPLTSHGFKDATTDPKQIKTWWWRWPRANVAVATGAPGPDVLDVDTKDGRDGMVLFDRAKRAGLLRGASAVIRTPSGGLHLWFAGTDQSGGAVGAHKALELKARGGYVLLPPSFVDDLTYGYQGRYELTDRRDGPAESVDFKAIRALLQPIPPQLGPRTPKSAARRGHGSLVEWLAQQGSGNRNKALFWATCRALETEAEAAVLDSLRDVAIGLGLAEREVDRTIESAVTRRTTGAR